MCYHRLYIYTICGHPHWGSIQAPCALLALPPPSAIDLNPQLGCPNRQNHPFQTLRFHSLCPACVKQRDRNILALERDGVGPKDRIGQAWRWNSFSEKAEYRGLAELRKEMREKQMMEKQDQTSREQDQEDSNNNLWVH